VLLRTPDLDVVETDVALGPRTGLVCDAHDLPFAAETFDCVVAQAVLEHVLDPRRCVDEIYRVLKRDGLVYAETPFMQQVHGGRYDFTRFTPLGHRRLFRHFEELRAGASSGPGQTLAWAVQYFCLGFAQGRTSRLVCNAAGRLLGFPWKYADRYLITREAALDGASGVYFIGRKSQKTLPDRDLVNLYRGGEYLAR
jgi:SAM-dependent methyltransferase